MSSPFDDELTDDLQAAAGVVREVTAADRELETPPESIWESIQAEVEGTATVGDAAVASEPPPPGPADSDAVVVDFESSRRRHRPALQFIGLAAAAIIVIVVGLGVVLTAGSDKDDEVLAAAALARLDNDEVVGSAELVGPDDELELKLDLPDDVDPGDGYFELWLINDEVTELVSLGPLTGDTAALPAGLDAADFPIVDVSFETFDGDPAHSGNSLVRGRLEA